MLTSLLKNTRGKKIKKRNGTHCVYVHTLHGSYLLAVQRYLLEDGTCIDYLDIGGNASNKRYSVGLYEFMLAWSGELSYPKLSELLFVHSGVCMSSAGLSSWVLSEAQKVSSSWEQEALVCDEPVIGVCDVDIYDSSSEEVLVLLDDVGVKAQKPSRKVARSSQDAKRHDSTVVLLEDGKGQFEYMSKGLEEDVQVQTQHLGTRLRKHTRHYHGKGDLPIVAISDGARSIRKFLEDNFSQEVCVILDWYHLQKKVCNLLSMISVNKAQKELDIQQINALLWEGKVEEAKSYIEKMSKVKNQNKRQEIITYLDKHKKEIIDYKRRKEIGKSIGSGRVEKANDLVVAHRQKKKGMSWSKKGSRALAILKVQQLNKKRMAA